MSRSRRGVGGEGVTISPNAFCLGAKTSYYSSHSYHHTSPLLKSLLTNQQTNLTTNMQQATTEASQLNTPAGGDLQGHVCNAEPLNRLIPEEREKKEAQQEKMRVRFTQGSSNIP